MTIPTQDADDVRVISARLYADDRDALFALVAEHSLDFGCRPSAHRDEQERLYTPAYLSPRELQELTDEGIRVEVQSETLRDETTAAATIGQGDRFEGGARPPQGAGSREEGSTAEIGPIMNVDEIGSAIDGLVNEYGLPTITLPNGTAEGAPSTGGQVGPGIDPGLYHVYFTAGVHARERGGPDGLIYFIADLLHAQRAGSGLTYGGRSYSPADVTTALNTGIVFFPLVNPDGVRHDQATDSLWRKNRNPASSDGSPPSVGVDINRNYDFLWDFRTKFDPKVTGTSTLASDNPRFETFHGTAPFSEPETRNVAWILDQFPRLRWYMDIHSAAGQVLHNWGDDENQSGDPGMSFREPRWDGRRGVLDDDYREWITEEDGGAGRGVARRVAAAMRAVGGRSFVPVQAVGLFATSGASDDYAFSRFQARPDLNKTYGFTMEFGYPQNFYPTLPEFHQNVLDVGAGLMEFCLAAAAVGLD